MLEGITVVVTCYNLEQYIGEAISSILKQASDVPSEILVIDDCSTDASANIVSQYQQVRLLRTPVNSGVLLATIRGLREATHDVVAFLDGDDVWHSEKLKHLFTAFSGNPRLGFVTHDLRYVDSDGELLPRVSRPSQVMPKNADAFERDRLIRNGILEQGDYVWLGSAYAVRRSVVQAEAFCAFAESLPDPRNTYQDWPLAVWCAAQKSVEMDYIPEKLFDYRIHGANHSGDARTLEKAIRNVRRSLNTLLAIQEISFRRGPFTKRANGAIRRKLAYYEYVLLLYSNQRWAALRGFALAQGYLFRPDVDILKEYMRFLGVQLLGAQGFIRLLSKS